MNEMQNSLLKEIGNLMAISLKIANPISQLHLIREKIMARGYYTFDKPDIMDELGRLQHITGELHSEMLRIDELLKREVKVK
jgi:hypothetical protein